MNKADQNEEKANIIQELKQNHTCTHTDTHIQIK